MSKSVFEAFGANAKGEVAGIEVEYDIGSGEPCVFRIARAGGSNVPFKVAAEKATRVYRRSGVDLNSLPPAVQDKVTRELYAKHIVLGWSGVYGDDGEPIEFSVAKCIELFTALPDLLQFIINEAVNFQNFRKASVELETGN